MKELGGEILPLSEKRRKKTDAEDILSGQFHSFITERKMQAIYDDIAHKFRAERIRQNVTVIQLEARTGIDRTAIYRMENCQRRFGFENMIRMCYGLGLSLNELYKVPMDWRKGREE